MLLLLLMLTLMPAMPNAGVVCVVAPTVLALSMFDSGDAS